MKAFTFISLILLTSSVIYSQQREDHIQITPENPTMQVNESLEFTATWVDDDGNLWPLSDPHWLGDSFHGTIAVNPDDPCKCTFTATSTGSSYITCYEGPPYNNPHGSTDITITGEQQLDVISVTPANVNLEVGEQQQFVAVGYDTEGNPLDPPITPVWSTDGGSITSDGLYTAPDVEGYYAVTAGVSGSQITGQASVQVASSQQLDRIEVTPANVNLQVGEQQQFVAKGYDEQDNPLDPPIVPQYSCTGGSITSDGLYTAPETSGAYYITVSVDGSEVTGEATVTVSPQGVSEQEASKLKVFPNPAKNILFIESNQKIIFCEIIDLTGNVLLRSEPLKNEISVNIGDFPAGVYFLHISSIDYKLTKKLVVEH